MKYRFKFLLITLITVTTISAQTDSVKIEEVVVTGTRNAVDVRHLPMTVTVIQREALTKEHQTSILPTVMQQVPGLFVTSRSMIGYGVSTGAAGGINLRGISSGTGQLMVLIDGHPQYQGIYGHPLSDSYQTMMAERVEVLRGPASVLYGSNAMGGVINIVTRRPASQNGTSTQANMAAGSYGTLQAEASNQLRSGKFSSTIGAQYGRTDNHRPHMGFEQYGGFLKLGYDINENWSASLSGNITHWNASNPGATTQLKLENDQYITRGEVSVALTNNYGWTSGALSAYSNFGRHKINDGYNAEGGKPQTDLFRSKDAVSGISLYQSAQLFTGNRTTVGVDYQHLYGRAYYTNRETDEEVTTPQRLMQSCNSRANGIAGYVDFRQDLTDWLTVDAGVRYDHHSIAGGEWIPQAGIVVRPMATGEVKAMVSKGFRRANPKEMFLYKSANEDLKPERLWNYELSWRHRLNGGFTYGANLFYIKADNLIQTINMQNVNTGEIENWGVELEAKYPVCPCFNINANASYMHMKEKIVAAPEATCFLGVDYHQDKWLATLGVQYVNHLYTVVGDNETKENFCLVNASISYTLTKNIGLWLRGENLLAQSYEINLGYPMPRATFMGGININF